MNSATEPPSLLCELSGAVARLQLNRPNKHNALDLKTIESIERAINQFSSTPGVRALILSAAPGTTFCAGASLDELASGTLSPNRFHALLDVIAACPLPTIAAIAGNVHGGGAELPLACDFRIGIRGITLQVPATRIGLCYPPKGIQRYTDVLGSSAAKRILLLGERLSADALYRLGYLDSLVDADEHDATVNHMCETLAGLAPLAVRATKELVDRAATGRWDSGVAQAWSQRCEESDDFRRGLAAARAKTRTQFSGD